MYIARNKLIVSLMAQIDCCKAGGVIGCSKVPLDAPPLEVSDAKERDRAGDAREAAALTSRANALKAYMTTDSVTLCAAEKLLLGWSVQVRLFDFAVAVRVSLCEICFARCKLRNILSGYVHVHASALVQLRKPDPRLNTWEHASCLQALATSMRAHPEGARLQWRSG